MTTFILRSLSGTAGPRIAVKDLIDVAGLPTTGGCRAIARAATPAREDARCLAGVRSAVERGQARIVGKVNLCELAMGVDGVNPWYGTPTNPLHPDLMPGGSSSGSAVAVASGEADIAIGTDTGGSVRVPAACCGVTGLKTTHGRISNDGVLPLSPSLDTVGPIARDVAGVAEGMMLLEPGFRPSQHHALTIGRVRVAGVLPEIDAAIDRALRSAGLDVMEIELPGWESAVATSLAIALPEGLRQWGDLIARFPGDVGDTTRTMLLLGNDYLAEQDRARAMQATWIAELEAAFTRVELLACPTLAGFPLPLGSAGSALELLRTMQINVAGVPALAQPVTTGGPLPASLQLFGPHGSEELLLATGSVIEEAAGWSAP